jgi:hypothetical protein
MKVGRLHSLPFLLGRMLNLNSPTVAEDLADLLIESGAVPRRYRHIVIDEAKDLLPQYLEVISNLDPIGLT